MIKLAKPSKHLLNLSTFLAKLVKVISVISSSEMSSEISSEMSSSEMSSSEISSSEISSSETSASEMSPSEISSSEISSFKTLGQIHTLFEGSLSGIVS